MNYYPEIFDSIPSLPYLLTLTVLLRYLIFPAFKLQFLRYKGLSTHFYPPIVSQRHWNSSIKTKAGRHQRLMFPNQKALAANCGRNIIFVLYDCEYKNLFLQNQNFYKKTDSIDFIEPLINFGLLLQPNKFQIKNPSFDLNINFLHLTVQQLLNKIPDSAYKKLPLMKTIEEITAQIIGLAYFGESLHNYTFEGKPVTLALTELVKQISNSSTRPIGQLLGDRITTKMPHYRTLKRKVQNLRQLCLKIIQEKTVQPEQKVEDKGSAAAFLNTNEEILNQFMGFFIDAISTTKHLVCISLFNLLQHSEYLDVLKIEREAVYRNPEGQVTLETVKRMEALQAFFQETLRFYPAAPNILARVAVKNHKLADLAIKKGDQVRVDMLASFFDEKFFEDPLRFDPERWRRMKQKLDPFMLTPFVGGNKSFSGQNMVIMMSKILISEFLEKFKFDLAECKNLGKITTSPHEHLNDIFFNISADSQN